MSADPAVHLDTRNEARAVLQAVRAARSEYAEFLEGVFSRLESVSGAVRSRQQSCEEQLEELRRQQRLWKQERAVLEHELEAVRNRAIELSDALARQKRDAELQQRNWTTEIRQMRRTLQEMAYQFECGDEASHRNPLDGHVRAR